MTSLLRPTAHHIVATIKLTTIIDASSVRTSQTNGWLKLERVKRPTAQVNFTKFFIYYSINTYSPPPKGTCQFCENSIENCLYCGGNSLVCYQCFPNFYLNNWSTALNGFTKCNECPESANGINTRFKYGEASTGVAVCKVCSVHIKGCTKCENISDSIYCLQCDNSLYLFTDADRITNFDVCRTDCADPAFYADKCN
jgi:hypothetical protein